MKIKELHIRNIASIVTADIDFEKGLNDPYGDPASVFLITGKTGSGKSAILDAISMALFKNTPRLNSVADIKNNKYKTKEGEEILINDITQYTREGIGPKDECYSLVVFEMNGTEYRAKLELGKMVPRSAKKSKEDTEEETDKTESATTKVLKNRDPKWTIQVGNNAPITAVKEVEKNIYEAIGLTFEQFCRMALLAQGQFDKFLTGGKEERERILEQLTNTELFSQYGTAIENIYKGTKEKLKEATTRYDTESTHTMPPEQIAQKQTQLAVINGLQSSLEMLLDANEKAQEHANTIIDNLQKKKEAEDEKRALDIEKQNDEFKEKEAFVKDFVNTAELRVCLGDKKELEVEINKAETEEEPALKATFDTLSADLKHKQSKLEDLKKEISELSSYLKTNEPNKELFEKVGSVSEKLEVYHQRQKELTEKTDKSKEQQERKPDLVTGLVSDIQMVIIAEANVAKKQKEIEDLQEQLKELHPETYSSRRNEQEGKKKPYEELQKKIGERKEINDEIQDLEQKIKEKNEHLSDLDKQVKTSEEDYERTKKDYESKSNLHDAMKQSVSGMFTSLRNTLISEHADMCPLCGQHLDAEHLRKNFGKVLTPLEEERDKAKTAYEKADKAYDEANSSYNLAKGEIVSLKRQFDDKKEKELKALDAIKKSIQELNLVDDATLDAEVENSISEIQKVIDALDKENEKVQEFRETINRLHKEKDSFDEEKDNANQAMNRSESELKICQKDISDFQSETKEIGTNLQKIKDEISSILLPFYPEWEIKPLEAKKEVDEKAEEYNAQKDKHNNKLLQEGPLSQQIDQYIAQRDNICKQYPDWKQNPEDIEAVEYQGEDTWISLLGQVNQLHTKVKGWKRELNEKIEKLTNYYNSTDHNENYLSQIEEKKERFEVIQREVNDVNKDIERQEQTIKDCETEIKKSMTALGIEDPEEAKGRLEELQRLQGLFEIEKQTKHDLSVTIQNEFDTDAENWDKVNEAEKAKNDAEIICKKWELINKYFGGTKFRTLVQSHVLSPLLANANKYLAEINNRYKLTCSRENEKLSILVLDRYNKDQIRSSAILSGGERFMISLALSLALSSLNRPDLNTNILFIDEGFGTLDKDNLESVMKTLETLEQIVSSTNRRVGIISHREELIERIPTKIFVEGREGRSVIRIENDK